MNISNEMVLAAKGGDARGLALVAEAFNCIAGVVWNRNVGLQIAVSLEDFQQELAMYWWRRLPEFSRERASASTWAFMLAETVRSDLLRKHSAIKRREPGRRVLDDARPFDVARREVEAPEIVQTDELNDQESELMHLFARGCDQATAGVVMGYSRTKAASGNSSRKHAETSNPKPPSTQRTHKERSMSESKHISIEALANRLEDTGEPRTEDVTNAVDALRAMGRKIDEQAAELTRLRAVEKAASELPITLAIELRAKGMPYSAKLVEAVRDAIDAARNPANAKDAHAG